MNRLSLSSKDYQRDHYAWQQRLSKEKYAFIMQPLVSRNNISRGSNSVSNAASSS